MRPKTDITVELSGEDRNVFNIIGKVMERLRHRLLAGGLPELM